MAAIELHEDLLSDTTIVVIPTALISGHLTLLDPVRPLGKGCCLSFRPPEPLIGQPHPTDACGSRLPLVNAGAVGAMPRLSVRLRPAARSRSMMSSWTA